MTDGSTSDEARFFRTPGELRRWLERQHATAPHLWIAFRKTSSGKGGVTYPQALDEALCFGWIDGGMRPIDDSSYRVRFSRRTPKSVWSVVNIARAEELIARGRMRPSGLDAFQRRTEDRSRGFSFEQAGIGLGDDAERELRRNRRAWAFWNAQTSTYRKQVAWWILSAKKEETRRRRLQQLIEHSANQEPVPPLRFGYRPARSRPVR